MRKIWKKIKHQTAAVWCRNFGRVTFTVDNGEVVMQRTTRWASLPIRPADMSFGEACQLARAERRLAEVTAPDADDGPSLVLEWLSERSKAARVESREQKVLRLAENFIDADAHAIEVWVNGPLSERESAANAAMAAQEALRKEVRGG